MLVGVEGPSLPQADELPAGASLVLVYEWAVRLEAVGHLGDNEAVAAVGMVAGALEPFLTALQNMVSVEVDAPIALHLTR